MKPRFIGRHGALGYLLEHAIACGYQYQVDAWMTNNITTILTSFEGTELILWYYDTVRAWFTHISENSDWRLHMISVSDKSTWQSTVGELTYLRIYDFLFSTFFFVYRLVSSPWRADSTIEFVRFIRPNALLGLYE